MKIAVMRVRNCLLALAASFFSWLPYASADDAPCPVTVEEQSEIAETSQYLLQAGLPQNWSNLSGCAVARIEVSAARNVRNVQILRFERDGSYVWTSIIQRM
ncbi:MAG: hypothetical protein ABW199_08395, partial [Caulobacterales bacterium]